MGSAVVVRGTLTSEGTLQLEHKIPLPPGPVEVIVKAVVQPTRGEDWWQYAQRARRELEEAGATFMTGDEMNAHIEWLRQSDPIDDLLQARPSGPEKPGC